MTQTAILFCGDTFLRSRDGADPFTQIRTVLTDSQVCINLETSLRNELREEKNVCLSVDQNKLDMIPETARIISLVNNHMWDSGDPARLVQLLERRAKVVIGPGNPSQSQITLDGTDIEFFSAYFGLPRLHVSYKGTRATTMERMLLDSNAQRKIVNLHWGYEHTNTPAVFQRDLAHRLIDAGASIIIGHHPHVPQGWETYCGAPIFYSLGNFNFWQFDTVPTENNKWGYMVRYNLKNGAAEPVPYRINDDYQPYIVSCEEKANLLSRLHDLSKAARMINIGTWFKTEYTDWYAHEFGAWKRLCLGGGSPRLWLKWIAWLCLPMQLKYYTYALRFRMCSIRRIQ